MTDINIPGAKEVYVKQEELLATFVQNRSYVKACKAITEAVREDYFFEKMTKMRKENQKKQAEGLYEKQAREYYSKYGTHGEF